MSRLARAIRLLPGCWLGGLVALGAIAAPAIMARVASPQAGQAVGRMLAVEAHTSLVVAVVALLLLRRRASEHAAASTDSGSASVLGADALLVLGAAFCTLAGHFGVQPWMQEAREGRGAFTFAALHAASLLFYGLKTALVAAWAWRTTDSPVSSH